MKPEKNDVPNRLDTQDFVAESGSQETRRVGDGGKEGKEDEKDLGYNHFDLSLNHFYLNSKLPEKSFLSFVIDLAHFLVKERRGEESGHRIQQLLFLLWFYGERIIKQLDIYVVELTL